MTRPDNPFAAGGVGMLYDRGRPYHHPRTLARIRALVGDDPLELALDVACGTGMSTVALADHAATVAGVDASREMLRAARRAPRVSYLIGNAERLPFADDTFDAVTCCSGVHWFDQERFFAELRRVLRPTGWVALYDHYFMTMSDAPEFREWARALFARYPLPERNLQVGDPNAQTPSGFVEAGSEFFDDPIDMTADEFADYQLTVSHCVAAVERGTPREEVRAWLLESTAPLFDGRATRTIEFLGSITCLRPVS